MTPAFRSAACTLWLLFLSAVQIPAPAHAGAPEAEALWDQGQAAYQQNRFTEAIGYYQRALEAFRRAGDLDGAGTTCYNLALAYEGIKDDRQALASYQASLEIYRKLNSPPDMAVNLLNIGVLEYRTFRRYDAALTHIQDALKIFMDINEEEFSALSAYHLGSAKVYIGKYREAITSLEFALRTNRKLKNAGGIAAVLHNMGRAYAGLGEYERAIPLYEEALAGNRQLNQPDDIAAGLNSLGSAYADLYRYEKAIDYYNQALDEARRHDLKFRIAMGLNNLGTTYFDLGRYDMALSAYQESLTLNRALSREADVAVNLNNIGNLYATIGQDEKALPYFKEALVTNRALHLPAETAINLNNIGMNYYHTGRYESALTYLDQALDLRRQMDNPREIAKTLDNIGAVYLFQKRYREAEAAFNERKALQARITGVRLNYSGLVETCIATGRFEEAMAYLKSMPDDARQRDAYRADYYSQYGRALKGEGRAAEASRQLLKSVAIIEEMRRSAGDKGGFLGGGSAGGRFRAYRALVESLAERYIAGDTEDAQFSTFGSSTAASAFYFAEATKARVLLEAMASASKNGGRARLPDTLRKQEDVLRERSTELDLRWEAAYRQGGAPLDALIADRQRLLKDQSAFVALLRKADPLYAALNYPKPMAADALALKPDEVLLEYALGEGACTVFVVRQGGISQVIRIPVGREKLEAMVKNLMASLSTNAGAGFSEQAAGELYEVLLSKALAATAAGTRIIIVPDGMLGMLPFEALVVAAQKGAAPPVYAADRWTFSYVQSATVLALTRMLDAAAGARPLFALGNPVYDPSDPRAAAQPAAAQPAGAPAAAPSGDPERFGFRGLTMVPRSDSDADEWKSVYFPPLPETEDEVRAIARLLGVSPTPPDVLLNLDASETRLRATRLGDYRMLHFATHADLPGTVQGIKEPFLLLGQVENRGEDDGFLTLSEVLDLDLHADMVVLSACVTGKGAVTEGEGVGSLASAFMHAGSKSVVVSLWALASKEAVTYMTTYYGYLKEGRSRSEALVQARRDMKAKYPNPFYWAVFILHGDG
ncbi:MAG: CHAT domain-containing protein [Pseudomonadota bacterium]